MSFLHTLTDIMSQVLFTMIWTYLQGKAWTEVSGSLALVCYDCFIFFLLSRVGSLQSSNLSFTNCNASYFQLMIIHSIDFTCSQFLSFEIRLRFDV